MSWHVGYCFPFCPLRTFTLLGQCCIMQVEFIYCCMHHTHVKIVNLCTELWGSVCFFLVCFMWCLPKPANLAFPSLCLIFHFRDWLQTQWVLHFHDWNNKFMLFCLFLHELQHICYSLPCLAFHCFPANLGVTWWHPCILWQQKKPGENSLIN